MDEFLALQFEGFDCPGPALVPVPGRLMQTRSLLREELIVWSKCRWLLIGGTFGNLLDTFGVGCMSCFV